MKVLGTVIADLMSQFPDAYVVDVDLSRSSGTAEVGRRYADRFVNVGVAEQNAMGVAAGLALQGLHPVVHTFAAFTVRGYEQIRTGIAYQNLPVVLCATKGGLDASAAGPTHQALDDLALMRAVPGMVVAAPGGVEDFRRCLRLALTDTAPTYLRVPSDDCPREAADGYPAPALGRGVRLHDGDDVTLVFTGTLSECALAVRGALVRRGVSAGVLYLPYVKPVDHALLLDAARSSRMVVTLEEHTAVGGLGSAVCELLAGECPTHVLRVGVPDIFCIDCGSHEYMLERYVGTVEDIAEDVADRHRSLVRRGRGAGV